MESEIVNINVRSIISKYENLTSKSSSSTTTTATKFMEIKRAKSLGNLIKTKSFSKFIVRNIEQVQIELNRLKYDIDNYRNYRKNDHIFYQNRLLLLLIEIINIDNNNNDDDSSRKHEFIDQIKELNKLLNLLLPDGDDNNKDNNVVKVINIPYSNPTITDDTVKDNNEDVLNSELMPSFQRLRSLFEQDSVKCDGLQMITMDENPKMSRRYVSHQELLINN